jgi:type III pantothenate kinase
VILCVDVGNTASKFALVRGTRVVRRAVVASDAGPRDLVRACARVLRDGSSLEAAALSSVRPQSTDVVVRAIVRATTLYPIVVNHRTPMPIRIGVRAPARVGADRLCAACGALGERGRHAIVVTVGSAITVNLVRNRVFLGGVIMPGPSMSLSAMHAFTAQLPKLGVDSPLPAGIDDTESAMRWGATLACAGGIRLAVEMLDRRAKGRPKRFVTGGFADRVGPWLPASWIRSPDLTLVGLARIANAAADTSRTSSKR